MIKAYWWKGAVNWGDNLSPLLLKRFANLDVEWDTISHSSIASIGSILEHIPPLWDGYILGSGRLHETSRLQNYMKTAKILAIRGPLSAKGIPGSFALGDPGLLADELVGFQEKTYDLGIVPHWRDVELVPRFQKIIRSPSTIQIINPSDDPLIVLRQIASCKRIVTSSLHGMIAADTFGIPRRVELCANLGYEGGDFKFRDYSESIRFPLVFGKMGSPTRWLVEDLKFAILDAYKDLENQIG